MTDVAKRAGVSIATASGVLNGSRYVCPELPDSVLKAASELDYTINRIARGLQSRSTQIIWSSCPTYRIRSRRCRSRWSRRVTSRNERAAGGRVTGQHNHIRGALVENML